MKKILTIGMFIILFSSFVSATEIVVNPSSFEVQLVGGESVNKTFSVRTIGFSSPTTAYLSYVIEEENGTFEGSEMWLNFSQNSVTLNPNQEKTLYFTINTIPNIYPDIYFVTITIQATDEETTTTTTRPSRGGGGIKTVCGNGICEFPENELNCPEDCWEDIVPPVGGGISPLTTTTTIEVNDTTDVEDEGFDWGDILLKFFIALLIIFVIYIIILLLNKKKPKEVEE